jgi:hypothetical protein
METTIMSTSNRKQYQIVLETPPEPQRGRPGHGNLQKFLARLEEEHPGEWSVLDRNRKHIGYIYNLKKKYPNLSVNARQNDDGTYGVWVKMDKAAKASV